MSNIALGRLTRFILELNCLCAIFTVVEYLRKENKATKYAIRMDRMRNTDQLLPAPGKPGTNLNPVPYCMAADTKHSLT